MTTFRDLLTKILNYAPTGKVRLAIDAIYIVGYCAAIVLWAPVIFESLTGK